MFAHVVKVILVKLLEMLRYAGMNIIIQWISQIHRSTLKIISIVFLIGQCWLMLQKNMFQRKVLEAYHIVLEKPTLNEQLGPDKINLLRNGVTWLYYSGNILTTWVFKLVCIHVIFFNSSCKITILCTDDGIKFEKLMQNIF